MRQRGSVPGKAPRVVGAVPVLRGPRVSWSGLHLSHAPPYPQLWEVSSGELLLSVLFDVGIMAVTMDLAEHHLFCGGSDGSIFQVDLCTWVSGWRWAARGPGGPLAVGPRRYPGSRVLLASTAWTEREELPARAGQREGVQRAQVRGWGAAGGAVLSVLARGHPA